MISRNSKKKRFIHRHSAARLKNLITVSCKPKSPKSNSGVVFTLFNTRSLLNTSSIQQEFVTSHNLDILCLTKTWLKSGHWCPLVDICPPNYNFLNARCVLFTAGSFHGFKQFIFKMESDIPVCYIVIYQTPRSICFLPLSSLF